MPTRLSAPKLVKLIGGKALVIPESGWNAHNFAAHGRALIVAMSRVARLTQRRSVPTLARASLEVFRGQLRDIIARATRKQAKAIENHTGQHADLWEQAIQEVLDLGAVKELATALMPPIQKVMAQGVSKTAILLGVETGEDVSKTVAKQSRKIAERITKISETTRANVVRIVNRSIDNGDSIVETANKLEAAGNEIFSSRSMTIARTELSNAWAEGAVTSFKISESITHVSVIGCEAREEKSPQYKGQSTCNYPDLPITEIDAFMAIGWHPNHTGTIVPSGFRNADGSAPD